MACRLRRGETGAFRGYSADSGRASDVVISPDVFVGTCAHLGLAKRMPNHNNLFYMDFIKNI